MHGWPVVKLFVAAHVVCGTRHALSLQGFGVAVNGIATLCMGEWCMVCGYFMSCVG
jgi:hypothetical protein